MTQSLFGPPTGGSFADKLGQARTFLANARGVTPTAVADPVAADPVAALIADAAPQAAPAAEVAPQAVQVADAAPVAAEVATEMAEPVAVQTGGDLAAAARAAAEATLADPAYAAAAQQQVEVVVQPRVVVQGQAAPTIVPIDVPIPAAHANVTIQPGQAVVIDAATGQPIAAQVAAAGGEVATEPVRGLRSWTAQDIGDLFGRGRVSAAPAAPASIATPTAAAAEVVTPKPSWRDAINDAIVRARGEAAPVADGAGALDGIVHAAAEAKPGLIDRIRANAPDLGMLRGAGSGAAATVAEEAVEVVAKTGGAGVLDELRRAAQVVTKVK